MRNAAIIKRGDDESLDIYFGCGPILHNTESERTFLKKNISIRKVDFDYFYTIFYTLPRLSELVEDEWISLCKFTRFTSIPLPSTYQWYHSRAELLDLKPSDWSQQDKGSNSVEMDNQTEWTDVQKKIIPWKNSIPDLDLELVFQDRAAKLGKSNSRLIVVASLIDKPTNLC
ncbi:probable methyltransferase TARBP1 [Alligator sinensis]|uniref:Probable methyltransferase TARBP1 n=1 Tax=Alligator sinensis TaxID=38654 RepID=A0A1U8DG59_ALLSI|nr:probable methyltransferase TARBP1 [Alligator sinensis]